MAALIVADCSARHAPPRLHNSLWLLRYTFVLHWAAATLSQNPHHGMRCVQFKPSNTIMKGRLPSSHAGGPGSIPLVYGTSTECRCAYRRPSSTAANTSASNGLPHHTTARMTAGRVTPQLAGSHLGQHMPEPLWGFQDRCRLRRSEWVAQLPTSSHLIIPPAVPYGTHAATLDQNTTEGQDLLHWRRHKVRACEWVEADQVHLQHRNTDGKHVMSDMELSASVPSANPPPPPHGAGACLHPQPAIQQPAIQQPARP